MLPMVPGETVYLDANRILTPAEAAGVWQFAWRLVAAPIGSKATLSYSNLVRAGFVPDVPGRYLIHLDATTARGVLQFSTYIFVDEGHGEARVPADAETTEREGTPDASWNFQGFTESQWEAMAG